MAEVKIDRRRENAMKSPKRGGSCHDDSLPYLSELGITISDKRQAIQFTINVNERVHRWAPYVQGFSASFVQAIFERYKDDRVVCDNVSKGLIRDFSKSRYYSNSWLDEITECISRNIQTKHIEEAIWLG